MNKTLWTLVFAAVLIWSGIEPKDTFTWFLEVLPAIIGGVLLALTYNRFRFTPLLYILILLHCVILMVGGHYTYAEVPLFDTLADWFDWERNNYDKVGHLAQGFIPAMITREIVVRNQVFNDVRWRAFFIVCFCLAFSAFYELIEWWVAAATGESAEAFLGTQGYEWDTQSDMMLALIGAVLALVTLSRTHDKQLAQIEQ